MRYDDMAGLDMYDDMGQFYSPDMVRDSLVAAGAGAGAILLASWITPKLPAPETWEPAAQHRMRAAVATLGGILVGRGLWDYNRDAAMAVIGGVAGLGLAQLVDSFFDISILDGNPLGTLPEDIELSAYDNDAMGALSALETTGVTTAPAAFADPTVTPEALMGFHGTVVQQETLGQYSPYMA